MTWSPAAPDICKEALGGTLCCSRLAHPRLLHLARLLRPPVTTSPRSPTRNPDGIPIPVEPGEGQPLHQHSSQTPVSLWGVTTNILWERRACKVLRPAHISTTMILPPHAATRADTQLHTTERHCKQTNTPIPLATHSPDHHNTCVVKGWQSQLETSKKLHFFEPKMPLTTQYTIIFFYKRKKKCCKLN